MLLQVAKIIDIAIPIFAIPVVVDNLGLADFGVITKILAVSAYFVMIGEWGFNTNLVSFYKKCNDKGLQYVIYKNVLKVKFAYTLILSMLMLFFCFFNLIETSLAAVTLLWIGSTIFQTRWYFQAVEKLPIYTIFSVISKSILLVYVFQVMDENSSKEAYIFFSALPVLVISILGNYYSFNQLKTSSNDLFCRSSFGLNLCDDFVLLLKEGWNLVSSRLISNIFNPVIVYMTGYYYDDEVVGMLGVFQKIVNGTIAVLTPINEVFYPKLASSYLVNIDKYKKYFKAQLAMILLSYFISVLFLYIFIEELFSYFSLLLNTSNVLFFKVYSIVIVTNLIIMALVNSLVVKGLTKHISMISAFSVSITILLFYMSLELLSLGVGSVAVAYVFQQFLSLLLVAVYYNRR